MSDKQTGAMLTMIRRVGRGNLLPGAEELANGAHHLTDQKALAYQYAGAAGQGCAVVLALIENRHASGIKPDPFSKPGSGAFITEQDLPSSSVLESKAERSARGSAVFRKALNKRGADCGCFSGRGNYFAQ
jgi:hypothetical protein